MLIKTVSVTLTPGEGRAVLLERYKEMEEVLKTFGLRMIQEFDDGFSCKQLKSGEWFAEFEPAMDGKYFDVMQRLQLNIGCWVKE